MPAAHPSIMVEVQRSSPAECRAYREGVRHVWVVESTCRPGALELAVPQEAAAFARGYFDAEGGVPHGSDARFYIQITQKDWQDLGRVRDVLESLGVRCGRLHNPSIRVDPDYWRFYILTASHRTFAERIGSWHPRKRIS